MTKLPGKSHDEHSRAAAQHALAVASGNQQPDEKEVDKLADAIQAATDKAVAEHGKADKEADAKNPNAPKK